MGVDTACSASVVATTASVALTDSECDQFVSAGVSISVGMFSSQGLLLLQGPAMDDVRHGHLG